MPRREVQSIEVSCFVQATEDEARVMDRIREHLEIDHEPEVERLEGHFGNPILHVKWHLTGEEAWTTFGAIIRLLGPNGRGELRRGLPSRMDEHRALYLRLDKQGLMEGRGIISDADPVRVRIKPRGFMMHGPPDAFYARLMESAA